MKQHTLKPAAGSTRKIKRIGRGGIRGTYSGRGIKGQGSRTGSGTKRAFEGGQTPLVRRMPKMKGFKNISKVLYFPLNLDTLERFEDGATVDLKALREMRIMRKNMKIKVLGSGKLTKKVKVVADAASESAIKKIEKAGGEVVLPKKS